MQGILSRSTDFLLSKFFAFWIWDIVLLKDLLLFLGVFTKFSHCIQVLAAIDGVLLDEYFAAIESVCTSKYEGSSIYRHTRKFRHGIN